MVFVHPQYVAPLSLACAIGNVGMNRLGIPLKETTSAEHRQVFVICCPVWLICFSGLVAKVSEDFGVFLASR